MFPLAVFSSAAWESIHGIFTRHLSRYHDKMHYIYCKANPNRINVYLTQVRIASLFFSFALALQENTLVFSRSETPNSFFIYIFRLLPPLFLVLVTLRVPMAAARTIRVLTEEPVLTSVNPQVFGTTAPVLYRL